MRILGGLMALGYEIGTIMKRTSTVYSDDTLTVKLDDIEGMGRTFIQACIFPLPAVACINYDQCARHDQLLLLRLPTACAARTLPMFHGNTYCILP